MSRMPLIIRKSCIAALLGCWVAPATAQDAKRFDPPVVGLSFVPAGPACTSPREAQSYRRGEIVGAAVVRNSIAGANLGTPVGLEEFKVGLVQNILEQIPPIFPSAFVACRVQGHIAGALKELARQQSQTSPRCAFAPAFWGALTGNLYCGIMERAVGLYTLRLPPRALFGDCEERFVESDLAPGGESVCTTSFEAVGLANVGERVACYPFSEGAFERFYESTRDEQCFPPDQPERSIGP